MYWMRIWKASRTRFLYSRFDDRHRTDIEKKGTLEFCTPKFLFCCQELSVVRMHIFSVKTVSGWMRMKKTLVGILVFDMIMGMLCLWAGGKRQDTTAPASQEVSTGKIAEEEDVAKKIALTFDDGPHPRYTEQLLDGLKERNVVATFFVTGENAQNYPNIIRREQEEGHLIGNHTYSHIPLTSGNRETFREELVKTNEILENITGEKVSFVRPPYGSWDKSFEKELNMFPVLWNIDPLDWCSHNAECIAAKVVEKAGDGDIILMHDYYDTSVTAALEVVDVLQKRGFQFVTVEEILFD